MVSNTFVSFFFSKLQLAKIIMLLRSLKSLHSHTACMRIVAATLFFFCCLCFNSLEGLVTGLLEKKISFHFETSGLAEPRTEIPLNALDSISKYSNLYLLLRLPT